MATPLIWYGELTTPGRLHRRGAMFVLGGLAWLIVFLIVPSLLLMAVAFAQRNELGQVEWTFTLDNFKRLLGFGILGWSADYLRILGRSAWVALVTTAAALVLAYPLAFFIATRSPRTRYLWLAAVIIPFCTNLVIRTYAWMLILAPQLPVARFFQWLGWIEPGAALYPSPLAIYLGMVTSSLPFAVLPLYASVERLDWSLVEAAYDLYASRRRVFLHAILPQTLPGLSVAVILTFIPAMGMFVVPDLLGGAKYMLVGNLIQQQFGGSRDWPFGAAASFCLMALTLGALFFYWRKGRGGASN